MKKIILEIIAMTIACCFGLSCYGQRSEEITGIDLSGPSEGIVKEVSIYRVDYLTSNGRSIRPPSGVSFQWTITGGTIVSQSETSCNVEWGTSPTGNRVAVHAWIPGNSNFDFIDNLTVTITGFPTLPDVEESAVSRCGPGTVTLRATPGANANTIRWYDERRGRPLGSGLEFTTRDLQQNTVYYAVSYNSDKLLESDLAAIDILIKPLPQEPLVSGDREAVGERGFVMSATGSTGNYEWYNAQGVKVATGASLQTSLVTQTTANYGYCIAIGSNGCNSNPVWFGFTIYAPPKIAVTPSYLIPGSEVTLAATGEFSSVSWKDADGVALGTHSSVSVNRRGTYTATFVVHGLQYVTSVLVREQLTDVSMNYVITNIIQTGGVIDSNPDIINDLPATSKAQTIQYIDGSGRVIQIISKEASPSGSDIIQPVQYDPYGREQIKYLPYVEEGINKQNGYYKKDFVGKDSPQYAASAQAEFYKDEMGIETDSKPYAETVFESSPLSRVLKQGAAGEDWQPKSGSDHTIKKTYAFNGENEVLKFSIDENTGALLFSKSSPRYYAARQLFLDVTLDEHGNEVKEYRDKNGRVILKRVQHGSDGATKKYADTYNVYNDLGHLVMVLPPEGVKRILANR